MKPKLKFHDPLSAFRAPGTKLAIQAPLPDFDDTLPILLSIRGQETERERSALLTPPGRRPHD